MSLTGRWAGRYSYESGGMDLVPFEVRLTEAEGTLAGDIFEPNTFVAGGPDSLSARLHGQRSGAEVTFVKVYRGVDQGDDPAYHGQLNADETRIDGVWWFPATPFLRGRFMMAREKAKSRAEAAEDREVELETR